jgi:hypothetical protein
MENNFVCLPSVLCEFLLFLVRFTTKLVFGSLDDAFVVLTVMTPKVSEGITNSDLRLLIRNNTTTETT